MDTQSDWASMLRQHSRVYSLNCVSCPISVGIVPTKVFQEKSNDSVDLLTKTTRKHEIHHEMERCNTIWCASGIKSHYFINDKLTETR
jgi:hypothetical protein